MQGEKTSTSPTTNPEPPFSVLSRSDKWALVTIASIAALFSPMTASIYFPAIPNITKDFATTTERINLTVTVYMVMQGVAPMVWGPLADRLGRRPVYVGCSLTLILTCLGLALVPTNAYWLLMLLRCLQAAGSASTIALGAGVIGDISNRAERGSFFGFFSLGPMLGPAIGPVVGGTLTQAFGWRALFWFMCIASGVCLIALLLFLPETMRSIVGNGSIRPSRIYREFLPIVGRRRFQNPPAMSTLNKPVFSNPFRILRNIDIVLLLIYTSLPNACFYAVTATISTQFKERYSWLTETEIGLCFLASGGGMFFGSYLSGQILDHEYQIFKRRHVTADGTPLPRTTFPIEKARLRLMPLYQTLFVAANVGYGWSLQKSVHIAVPLILHIILGATVMMTLNATQTMLVDLLPTQGSSITACNNLFRCTAAAAAVSIIDLMFRRLKGPGWAMTLMALIWMITLPLVYIIMQIGPRYRKRREEGQ